MGLEQWSDQVAVVRLTDDPQFTDDLQLLSDMMEKNATFAVLDLSAVRFINSSNIAHLLRLRKQAVSADLRLILCNVSDPLWGTFLTTGLDKVFEFSDNLPTALATMKLRE